MDGKIEQRICYEFCGKFGISATEALEILRELWENILDSGF
jgi:hypothetical protein